MRRGQARAVRPGHGRGEFAAADALPAGAYCRRQRPARGVCGCGAELLGDGQYPPSDAVYYPLYTKCAELELPLCINTGIPGPPIPGEVQNPIHLDRVCVRFPELKLCMIHGADPWWDIAIRLLIKYANLRLMTSAWSPKRLPESLLHYMRTRGKGKVIFGSDWPVLKMHRVVPEAAALDLPADVLENYLYNNAQEFFFSGQEER
ncbi:amidohydrolase family protein [Mycobacterium intracellulare]|uniref:amidohydrolase family protein n=1 Tax=Mycobacterium intracellulare TaxID=1767 RepID=UPI0009B68ED4|nr:amidohydrolase family protein [Mycobacterium intracellulare]